VEIVNLWLEIWYLRFEVLMAEKMNILAFWFAFVCVWKSGTKYNIENSKTACNTMVVVNSKNRQSV
jgi:hypothetical protein